MTDKQKAAAGLRNAGFEAGEANGVVMVYFSQGMARKETDDLKSRVAAAVAKIGYEASWGISSKIPKDHKVEQPVEAEKMNLIQDEETEDPEETPEISENFASGSEAEDGREQNGESHQMSLFDLLGSDET